VVEKPGNELVGVLEGKVHAFAASWRDDVGGVTGQEQRAAVHRLGDIPVKLHELRSRMRPGTSSTLSAASRGVISFQIHSAER